MYEGLSIGGAFVFPGLRARTLVNFSTENQMKMKPRNEKNENFCRGSLDVSVWRSCTTCAMINLGLNLPSAYFSVSISILRTDQKKSVYLFRVAAILEGKGAGKQGKYQGKANKLSNRSQVEALLRQHLKERS